MLLRKLIGLAASLAVAFGGVAMAAAPAAHAATSYYLELQLTGESTVGIVSNSTLGDQVTVSTNSSDWATFTRVNMVNEGGTAYYELKDSATGDCLHEDKSLTNKPFVEEACDDSGDSTQTAEEIADPSSGNMAILTGDYLTTFGTDDLGASSSPILYVGTGWTYVTA